MSRDRLACTRCGYEGDEGTGRRDVRFRLTSLEEEAAEDGRRVGTVRVAVHVDEDRNGPHGIEYSMVPERFSNEARCVDREACRDRVAAARLAEASPVVVAAEEVPPWL